VTLVRSWRDFQKRDEINLKIMQGKSTGLVYIQGHATTWKGKENTTVDKAVRVHFLLKCFRSPSAGGVHGREKQFQFAKMSGNLPLTSRSYDLLISIRLNVKASDI